jgi:predicted NBD/HSP70 family sugar kinase
VTGVAPAGFVIGVDFGRTKVAIAGATPQGEIVKQVRFGTDARHGADQAVRRAGEACRALIAETEAGIGGRCVAAGVVSRGVVLGDRIALAPNVPG